MKRKTIRRSSHSVGYHRPKRQLAEAREAVVANALDKRATFHSTMTRLYDSYIAHMGGEDNVTATMKSLCFDAALCGAMIFQDAQKLRQGIDVPREQTLPVVNTRRRLLKDIGLDRRQVDVTIPDLAQFLDAHEDK